MICRGEGKRSFRTSKRVCVRMNKTCVRCQYGEDVEKHGYMGSACQDCTRCKQHTDMWTEKFAPPMREGYPEPTCIGDVGCIHRQACKWRVRCAEKQEEKRKFLTEGTQEMWANGYRQFDHEGLFYRDHDSSPRCPECGGTICSGDNPGSLCYDCNSKKSELKNGEWVPKVKT